MRTNSANAKSTVAAPAHVAVESSANGASCVVTANGVRTGTRWLALPGRRPVWPVHPAACAKRIPCLALTESRRLNG
jgi:hypothetical protein